jgi:2-haloacid dehalogenase
LPSSWGIPLDLEYVRVLRKAMKISDFDTLTFDCYGTLIDWETGIAEHLGAWFTRHHVSVGSDELLAAFGRAETRVEAERPTPLYTDVLRAVHGQIAARFGLPAESDAADAFAASVGNWPAFPDTADALRRLEERHRLVVISNVDRSSFAQTEKKLGVALDAVITAEEVGVYKPDLRMFERAFEILRAKGVDRSQILHVAQSLYHDHVPAKNLGLRTVWVNRRKGLDGWGATPRPDTDVVPDIEVATLAELAALSATGLI